ncbi:hypothetical protein PS903_02134 [Pseudomonas fluorescens]|nr:hypothetical protein PS903_02134 [Pseudomonas fluorescens]
MTLQITTGSTGLDDQNRARRLPPNLLRRTNAKLDENDSLQAEVARLKAEVQAYRAQAPDPDKKAAMKARALHAGATKSKRLHASIDIAVERHRLQLVNWTDTATARAIWLTKQINMKKGKFNEDGSPSVSGWRTVYDYLNTLQL